MKNIISIKILQKMMVKLKHFYTFLKNIKNRNLAFPITHLLHWAVHSEGLVHTGGLCTTALAPNSHVSRSIKFFLKLILFDSCATFPELPRFLMMERSHCMFKMKYIFQRKATCKSRVVSPSLFPAD